MRRYIAGGITILILASVSTAGYVFFGDAFNAADDNSTSDGDQPVLNISREMPGAAQPGDTVTVALNLESESPINTTVHERIQIGDTVNWRNITVRNARDERTVYTIELPDEVGEATFTTQLTDARPMVRGDETLSVSSEPYEYQYEPPAIETLLPEDLDEFSRAEFSVEDSDDAGVEKQVTTNYESDEDRYEVEVRKYETPQLARDSMATEIESTPEEEQDWYHLYETRAYQIEGDTVWTADYFKYTVSGADSQELVFALAEVHRP